MFLAKGIENSGLRLKRWNPGSDFARKGGINYESHALVSRFVLPRRLHHSEYL